MASAPPAALEQPGEGGGCLCCRVPGSPDTAGFSPVAAVPQSGLLRSKLQQLKEQPSVALCCLLLAGGCDLS